MYETAEHTASGHMISGEALKRRNAEIKSEVIKALHGYDLTIGQAIYLLEECRSELSANAFQHPL